METPYEVLPDPKRLIEGLRDTGYEFNTAMADIIDNSIAADATRIDITIRMDYRGNTAVSVADNGCGMDREGLINAMRYGSDRRPNPASLGKFGLGLKTASTAFCRQLSVISRNSSEQPLLEAKWDLDHVEKWEILLSDSPAKEIVDALEKVADGKAGTIVVWSKIDRLMKSYADPGGGHAQNALQRIIKDLRTHVGMVYQRFLDQADSRASNIAITINGEEIIAWDPFCIDVSDIVGDQLMPVEMGHGKAAEFRVRAYILPRSEEFVDKDRAKLARIANERQGIYIYREGRLIHDADWLGMFVKEPHGTLLRVEFSFTHELDEAFHIDIKKSKIILNEDLWTWLKEEFLTAPRREANKRNRKGLNRKAKEKAKNSHIASNRNIGAKEDELDTADVNVINAETGECDVTNKNGQFRLKLKVGNSQNPEEVYVQPADGIDDNALFEPAIIDLHKAVRINTAHPYYHKVYIPNLASGVTIQGMDSLLWALCTAELSTINDATSQHFEEMRFEVSRLLRKLVEDLPEPVLDDDETS